MANHVNLQDRDMALIRALAEDFRVLTRDQIAELFPMGSTSRLNFRLKQLRDAGFLSVHPVAAGRRVLKHGYYLGPQAQTLFDDAVERRLLASLRVQIGQLSDRSLVHRLLVDSVHIRFLTASRHYPNYKLLTWVDQYSSWWQSLHEYGVPFQSDGYCEYLMLLYFESLFTFFLEVDRGTERGQSIRDKIDRYVAFGDSGDYERQFAAKTYNVLFIASTDRRAQSILKLIEEKTDKYFWVTSWDRFRAAKLFDHYWLRPHQDGFHSLVPHT
jgi:hypothetical protein